MAVTGLDHLQISAPRNSADRVRQFYVDALELVEIDPPENLVGREGLWFALGRIPLHVALEGYGFGNEPRFLALTVNDLDFYYGILRDKIAPIDIDRDDDGNMTRLKFKDPFGNSLELAVEAPGTLDEAVATHAFDPYMSQAEKVAEFSVPTGEVEAIAFSPDGRWLAAGSVVSDPRETAPTVTVWDIAKGGEPEVQVEMGASVWEMAFSPTGKELVTLSQDGSVESWRTSDWESEGFAEHAADSSGLAYTAGGQLAAIGSGDVVHVYRPTLEQFLTVRPRLGTIESVAFDHEGTLAVVGEAKRIQLWTLQPAQRSSYELLGFDSAIGAMAFCPNQPILAGLTEEGQILIWDMYNSPEEPTPLDLDDSFDAFVFAPRGDVVAAACGTSVRLYDWRLTEQLEFSIEASSQILSLKFSPDGRSLAVGCDDGRVQIWKVR